MEDSQNTTSGRSPMFNADGTTLMCKINKVLVTNAPGMNCEAFGGPELRMFSNDFYVES